MSRSGTLNNDNKGETNLGSVLTLERKLELLESRFTQPGTQTSDLTGLALLSTPSGNDNRSNGSEHAFSFPASEQQQHVPTSKIPSSSVRSRRRPSVKNSLHAVEMAAARHLRKVAAGSPVHGLSVNTTPQNNNKTNHANSGGSSPFPSPGGSSSSHTLLTSHVQRRVVAETPPVIVSPQNKPPRTPPKPAAARNILLDQHSNTGAEASTSKVSTSNSQKRKKSTPKRKNASVKDKTVASPEHINKKPKIDMSNIELRSPKVTSTLSELSRDRSNQGSRSSKKAAPPANNTLIHDFFTSATKKKPGTTQFTQENITTPISSSTNTNTVAVSATATAPSMPTAATTTTTAPPPVDWHAKYLKAQKILKDKEEQLKAVSNNKTILHTALQAALEKTKKELTDVQASAQEKQARTSTELEELMRWKVSRKAKELRERLAADGARLGRIVFARAGMRAVETWEEGYATKDLEQRKLKLKEKKKALEQRMSETMSLEGMTPFEAAEAKQAIKMHLENLRMKEYELKEEENALNDEKGAHIRALKRVASEDASRFRSRPKLNDRYLLHHLLGKGGFSEVWRGYDLIELREVAVKIHQLDPRWTDSKKENYTKHVSREYEIHRNVRHSRIVSLYDVFEIDNNSFATVLECCNGTDLDTILKSKKRLPERHARAILLQILSGMSYLSQPSGSRQGIIHYDLKPGNILFDESGDAKITDFGLSKIVDTPDPAESMELTSQGAGTYWYLPPECFVTTERVRISNKVDVWSIGVIYYQMLYGVRPFGEGKSQDKLLTDHTMLNAQKVTFHDRPKVSEAGKEFIRQCLTYDQAFRPTIAQLCENSYLLKEDMKE